VTKKVSVIFTNYNHSKYLEEAFLSIVNQTYDNIEIIMVDDGSTDDSLEKMKLLREEYDGKPFAVSLISLEKNMGKWFALNKGIEAATGELIALQDADDASMPQRIERQASTMIKMGSFHNLCGFIHCFDEETLTKYKNDRLDYNISLAPIDDHSYVTRMVHQGFNTPGINHYYVGEFEVHGASTLFYKSLWTHGMKFLPGNLGLRCQKAEDSDHNTKMTLLLQKTSVLREKLYCYRRNTSTNNAWLEDK
jgi:glycosyltransferase involved in cell wall biosynthesis